VIFGKLEEHYQKVILPLKKITNYVFKESRKST